MFDGCFYRKTKDHEGQHGSEDNQVLFLQKYDGAMERLLEKQNADDNEATTNVEAHDNLFEVGNDVDYDSDASVEFL